MENVLEFDYTQHCHIEYPLVICHIAIENAKFQWENQLFLLPFSIAM